jgi:uncharacterized protein (DUF1330 family)
MTNKTVHETATSERPLVAMLGWLAPGAEVALAQFRQEAAPLFAKYDLRVERVLAGVGKGQLVGSNPHEVPQLLQVISFPSMAAFQAYTSDPDYVRLARQRDAYVQRMAVVIGMPLDVSTLHPTSTSTLSQRLYGVAFLRFHPDGAAGLTEFNQRASGLFARHGMHVERMFDVAKTVAPIGEPLVCFAPERVIVFYLDDPAALRGYATDPEYVELAPIRDRGLAAYDFFLGKVPA